ncbi:hypothetical protein C8F01DRAFT_1144077 [Mycena amicta]|nr:hypothetical protein C8F01DRAFT_1144077 [Mycena amicta]
MALPVFIPPEIWIHTFKDPELSDDDLQSLCLTDRTFSHLARPLLFSHFQFRAYFSRADSHPAWEAGPEVLLPNENRVWAYLERLDFWLSDAIAPLVRTCEIETWDRRGWLPSDAPLTTSDDPDGLLGELIPRWERFSRLQGVTLSGLAIGANLLFKLSRMSTLRELRVNGCTVKTTEPFPLMLEGPQLSEVSFTGSKDAAQDMDMGLWTPFLDPRYLRKFKIGGILRSWNDGTPHRRFPLVTELSFTLPKKGQTLQDILAKFPAVQTLTITQAGIGYNVDDPTNSVLLHGLAAGCEAFTTSLKNLVLSTALGIRILPVLLPQATSLTHLTLNDGFTSSSQLLENLPRTLVPAILSLSVTLFEKRTPTIPPILERFPNVRELRVDLHRRLKAWERRQHSERPFTLALFNDILTSGVLSAEIGSLALRHSVSTNSANEVYPEIHVDAGVGAEELKILRDTFIGEYTKLTTVLLHGGGLYLTWHRDTSGYATEHLTDNRAEAGGAWNREFRRSINALVL